MNSDTSSGSVGKSNQTWRREELILALELYFDCQPRRITTSDPKIIALSKLLNVLPFNTTKKTNRLFRNPNGVRMKLMNFLRFDPSYGKKGLSKGSRLEEKIWAEFSNDGIKLKKIAGIIRQTVNFDLPNEIDSEDGEKYFEGELIKRIHLSKERNYKVILRVKKIALKKGSLNCEVCGFDYRKTYGDIGIDFIEAHHTLPISEYKENQETRITDIALLCANCHRMVHRQRPWLSVEKLKSVFNEQSQKMKV